jgi:hypothetical protein
MYSYVIEYAIKYVIRYVICMSLPCNLIYISSLVLYEFLTVQIRSAICTSYDKVPHDARVELLVASVCVEGVNRERRQKILSTHSLLPIYNQHQSSRNCVVSRKNCFIS